MTRLSPSWLLIKTRKENINTQKTGAMKWLRFLQRFALDICERSMCSRKPNESFNLLRLYDLLVWMLSENDNTTIFRHKVFWLCPNIRIYNLTPKKMCCVFSFSNIMLVTFWLPRSACCQKLGLLLCATFGEVLALSEDVRTDKQDMDARKHACFYFITVFKRFVGLYRILKNIRGRTNKLDWTNCAKHQKLKRSTFF